MPTTTSRSRSLSFFAAAEAALDVALEAAPGAGCRSSRQPPLAKMLEVSIATALPPPANSPAQCADTRFPARFRRAGANLPDHLRKACATLRGLGFKHTAGGGRAPGTSVRPSSTTASSTVAAKLSPVCADALDNAVCRRTRIGVPSGNFVVDGISGGRAKFPAAALGDRTADFANWPSLGRRPAGGYSRTGRASAQR